jgi:hypothetical protein
MEKLVEHSQIHRKNRIVIGVVLGFLLGMAALSVYFWVTRHSVDPYRLFTPILIAGWVISRAASKFTYEADKKALRIVKTGLLGGEKTFEIPYRDIDGIYYYEPKLMSIIKFRRTFRLHSALDGRPVWVIAYEAPGRRGKPENRRAYFKPSDVMLELLHEKMPSKVKVTEEDIFAQKVAREK